MELIAHASEGLKDRAIAQAMGVQPATVNSYWARIREKLGPLSRTLLVVMVLRHKLEAEIDRLRVENRSLKAELQVRDRTGEAQRLELLLGISDTSGFASEARKDVVVHPGGPKAGP